MLCPKCGSEISENAKFCTKCGNKIEQPVVVAPQQSNLNGHNISAIWPEWQIEGKPLGKGSFGVVYKAVRRDHNVESYAAIKVISIPADPSEVDSLRSEGLDMNATRTYLQGIVNDFVSEIQLMESLKGVQNIVSVEDYKVVEKTGEIGWDIYIRMELLTPFNTHICDKKLTEEEVIKLGCDICTALEICGKRNIIHRDIKPENIFINDFGYFKLGDFGIARKMENMTGGLSQKGTFNYMAPEVATSSEYDARVDTYSLGIVLYRLLNGNRLPFLDTEKQLLNPNERRNAVDRRIRGEELPAPCEASPAMADLILRACAFDPDMRFASATEMKQALMSVANGTYQMAAVSGLDKTTSVRKAPADYDKTTSVRKAPAATNQKSAPAVNTFGSAPKKKSKLPAIIAAVLAAVILIGVGIFAIPKFLGDNDSSASDNSTDKSTVKEKDYSRTEEKEIAAIISEAEALANEEDYEGALAKVNAGLKIFPKSENLKKKSEEYTTALNAQIKATTLEEAATLAESGDYVGAMAVIKNAQDTYGDDADYQEAYDTYNQSHKAAVKAETFEEAEKLAESGDYVGAIAVIKNAQDTYGDDADYQNAYETYNQAHKAAVKADAMEKANSFAEQEDYLNAYKTINDAIKTVGDDAGLTAKAEEYENAYVADISSKVDTLVAENNISAAKDLLRNATNNFPNNDTLKSRTEDLNKYKTVLLNTLSPINGGFTWNDGTPKDPFGNDYSDIQNYTILHENNHYSSSTYSAEYKIDGQYDLLTFTISPYSDFGQNCRSYVQVYADDSLRYTLPQLVQKTQPQAVSIDISGATYIKIVIHIGADYGCVMLSDVMLSCVPNYVSSQDNEYTSLSTLDAFNGSISWDNGYPENTRGDDYTKAKNYSILHENNHYSSSTYSVEYFVNKQYSSLSLNIAPAVDFGSSCTSHVKIYLDDVLVYTSPTITQKTVLFNTGNLDLSNASYLKIVIEIGADYGCLIVSDALLKNK